MPFWSITLAAVCEGLETGVKIGLPVGNDGILDQCYHNRDREEIWDMFDKEWKA